MFSQAFIAVAFLAVAAVADEAPKAYAPPAPKYHRPSYEEINVPPKYDFSYGVSDHYSGNSYQAAENRDGYITSGSYRVALPDGRTQIVTYSVHQDSGYVADVQYEGQAVYPEDIHGYNRPVYQAAAAPAVVKEAPAAIEIRTTAAEEPQQEEQVEEEA